MSEPVRVVVQIYARSDAADRIGEIVRILARESRKEQGCMAYDVLQNLADPTHFVLVEEWDSVAALNAHNQTVHFHAAVTQSAPLLAKPLEVGRFRAIG